MGRRWSPGSAANFRDIGCQPTVDGLTRPGVLFRSDSPQFLHRADANRLVNEIGLRLVVDLRFADEARTEGRGPLQDTAVNYLNVPIVGAGGADMQVALLDDTDDSLAPYYVTYVQHSAAALLQIYRALAARDGLPALVHCAAGKDRTGVVVAVLLSALGVTDDAIVADYARTGDAMPHVLRRLGTAPTYAAQIASQEPDDVRAMAQPETMRGFLTWLKREYGSGRELLLAHGLEPEALDVLRHRLVDRAAA